MKANSVNLCQDQSNVNTCRTVNRVILGLLNELVTEVETAFLQITENHTHFNIVSTQKTLTHQKTSIIPIIMNSVKKMLRIPKLFK